MASDTQQYNGWANRDTWLVSLWLNNDEGYYRTVYDYTKQLVGQGLPREEIRKAVQKRIRTESYRIRDPRNDFNVHYKEVSEAWMDDNYDYLVEEVSE